MENNENFVIEEEEITENVEETTEETEAEEIEEEEQVQIDDSEEKRYTRKELEGIMRRRLARQERQIRKEYEKDRELTRVIQAGTGQENVEEVTDTFREHYRQKGIDIPNASTPTYSERENEILAAAEAKEIIEGGYEEVQEELDRLSELGVKNMTPREKQVYKKLAEYHKTETQTRELAKLGVSKEIYESDDFKAFKGQFTSEIPLTKIYQLYEKTIEKPRAEKIGSLKNGNAKEEKKYYTPEEVDKLTEKDFDDPKIMQRVRESMLSWEGKK